MRLVFIAEGVQLPVTPSLDVVGNGGAVDPVQSEFGIGGKVGFKLVTTVISTDTGLAQLPVVGVNVYVVVPSDDVLIVAGLHVPVIPSSDVPGSAGGVPF